MIKKIYPHNIFQAITLIIISIVITGIPVFVFKDKSSSELFEIICFCGFFLIAIAITILINRKNGVSFHFNFGVIKPKLLLIAILILFLFHLGINRIISWAFVYFLDLKDGARTNFNLPLLFGMLLAAPILEELLFRGIILKGFLSNYNAKMAIFISVIIFAVFHGNIIQGTHAFFVGGFISYIYFREQNLTMPILLHFSNNLIGGISMYWRSQQRNLPMTELYGAFTIPIYIFSIMLFLLTILWFFKKGYAK